mmetsp:Transcript_94040/g.210760  ORF Transcript_94040/g.210760 Transcript_94040/m.210760 type:complete len:205 (+) Transcript_94040:1292-1906(+)
MIRLALGLSTLTGTEAFGIRITSLRAPWSCTTTTLSGSTSCSSARGRMALFLVHMMGRRVRGRPSAPRLRRAQLQIAHWVWLFTTGGCISPRHLASRGGRTGPARCGPRFSTLPPRPATTVTFPALWTARWAASAGSRASPTLRVPRARPSSSRIVRTQIPRVASCDWTRPGTVSRTKRRAACATFSTGISVITPCSCQPWGPS